MIRLAVQSDVDAIARVHVTTWQSAYRGHMPDAHLDSLDPSRRAAMWSKALQQPATVVLVAIAGDRLVGFCSLMPSRDEDATTAIAEIVAIYVDPTFSRSGFGSSLVKGVVEAARSRSFTELTLWVLTDNAPARHFYEARGFNTDGRTKTEERWGFPLHETRYRRRIAP
jgi:ribosomal protein S18 acetylase RimI-like enzyme